MGLTFFAFIMGSINSLLSDDSPDVWMAEKIENLDWFMLKMEK